MKQQDRRLLIVFPHPYFDTNPTLTLLTQKLVNSGWKVDVLTIPNQGYSDPGQSHSGVNFIYAPANFFHRSETLSYIFFRSIGKKILGRKEEGWFPFLPAQWWGRVNSFHYNLIIGVDPSGIVIANQLNVSKRPLVYLSFEIMFSDELDINDRPLWKAELEACQNVSLFVVQDEERLAALRESRMIPDDKVCLVPVSRERTELRKSYYLREKYKISDDKKIVLFAGTLHSASACDDFEELVSFWPEKFVLVLHSNSDANPLKTAFLKKLSRTGRIFISSEVWPSQKILELYASADYGLAPYRPSPDFWYSGKNIENLGLSSGKVSAYAQCGKPILARPLPIYERIFPRFKCGKIYQQISLSGVCLEEMDKQYDVYQKGAFRFYDECLDPAKPVGLLVERISQLTTSI